MSAREDIAAAASTVAGVNVSPYYRTPRPGEGHVRLSASAPDSSFQKAYVDTWEVIVPLSQDIKLAEQKIDTIRGPLTTALYPVMYITAVQPIELIYDGGSIPALSILGTREA